MHDRSSAPRLVLAIALLALFATPAPTSALELTLDELVDRALEVSYDVDAARKREDMTQARVDASTALLASNPFVSFSFWDTTDTRIVNDGREGIGPSYTLSVSQTFEIAGQRGKRMEVARRNAEVAAANVASARDSLVIQVRRAFFETLEAHQRVQFAYELLHWRRELIKAYRRASAADRNGAEMRASRAEGDYAAEKHSLYLQESRLRRLLDVPAGESLVLVGDFEPPQENLPSEEQLVAFALEHRADLAAHRAAAASDEAYLSLNRRSAIPNVTLSGFVSRSDDDDDDEIQFGASISVPLPVFRTDGPNIREALAERQRSQAEARDVERTVERDVREARYAVVAAARGLQRVRQEILPRARETLSLRDAAFDRGEAGIWELVNAEIDLVEARQEELSAQRIHASAVIELERAIGGEISRVAPSAPASEAASDASQP